MANPVVRIGVPGTSQYRVDWSPIAQGWGDLGRGISEGVDAWRGRQDREDERRQKVTQGIVVGRNNGGRRDCARADEQDGFGWVLAGLKSSRPSGRLSCLRPKAPDSYSLSPGSARYGPGGAEIARNPAAAKDDRTTEQRNLCRVPTAQPRRDGVRLLQDEAVSRRDRRRSQHGNDPDRSSRGL